MVGWRTTRRKDPVRWDNSGNMQYIISEGWALVDGSARDIVLKVLDWKHGYFELTAGQPTPGTVEVDTTVTHLLLEHARLHDEATRRE